jgi:hypothetical protein
VSLEIALERLLFDGAFREGFLRGETAGSSLSEDEIAALRTIDREQLVSASRLVCEGILRRSHRGTGSLLDAFPRTIEAWRRAHPDLDLDALADELTSSPQFGSYRALPTCEDRMSLEEIFFRFAEEREIGEPATRLSECASAILCALAITPSPSFAVPAFLRRGPAGYFTILGREEPTLLAAIGNRFVRGQITPFLAALLTRDEPPEQVATQFGVASSDLAPLLEKLSELGLLLAQFSKQYTGAEALQPEVE